MKNLVRILCAVIVALICVIVILFAWYEVKIRKFSRALSDLLDDMIDEKHIDFTICKETLDSKLQYKLKRLSEMLKDKTRQWLEEKKVIQTLVSDISHQVKTPIANIKMYNEIMMERDLSEKMHEEFLQLSKQQIDKLDFLMQSMIKMSRLENGVVNLLLEASPISETLAKALGGIILKAEQKGINLTVNCDDAIIANHDVKWTAEAILNILDNAVKYTYENGSIEVQVQSLECYVVICIKDNGIGISEEEQALVFRRFYRSGRVHSEEGVGIGLSLAREILMQENGYIRVKSELNKGSEFYIYLLKGV